MESIELEKNKLSEILKEFDDLDILFEELKGLSNIEYKKRKLNIVFAIEAGKIAEEILVFICNKSRLKINPINSKVQNFEPDFNDYIINVYNNKIIDKELKSYFDAIRITRNKAAHRSVIRKLNFVHDPLDIYKIGTIHGNLKYIVDWFLSVYLCVDFSEFSLKNRNSNTEGNKNIKLNSSSLKIDNLKVKKITEKKPSKMPVVIAIWIVAIGFSSLIAYSYLNLPKKKETNDILINKANENFDLWESQNTNNTKNQINSTKDEKAIALNVLNNYYSSINGDSLKIDNFFSDFIFEFKTIDQENSQKNISSSELMQQIKLTKKILSPEFYFFKTNLKYLGIKNGFNCWQYTGKLSDFKKDESENRDDKCIIEFNLNSDNKITSLTEKQIVEGDAGS